MTLDTGRFRGACHCGSIQFEVSLSQGLRTARRCNCSICRMRGAIAVSAPLSGFKLSKGHEVLKIYQFNSGTAKHYFCSNCGIYTHHQRRSNPGEYGVNVACLEGVSPFDFAEVPVTDGIHHASDFGIKEGSQIIGTLKFMPATPKGPN